jgi:hypothetical protein
VKKPERLKPKAIDRAFMGAMFRRADQWTKTQLENDERVVKAREEGYESGVVSRDHRYSRADDELKELQKKLDEFQKVSGIEITRYGYGNIGDAVKKFMHSQKVDVVDDLELVAGWIEGTAKGLRERADLVKQGRVALAGAARPVAKDPDEICPMCYHAVTDPAHKQCKDQPASSPA